jgi:hypothetical protein
MLTFHNGHHFGPLPEGVVKSTPTKEPKKLAIALMSFFA